ncbi:Protein CBG02322 [Caenorhabditis briggsae]|uniref:Protein CBG02322 n=1 Tax=Caenorhabditis briggsae TaxID=6238 RepID=A8WUL3_CAEBR|nr:Protein CBG02322 [Caenorhabditis briggsae]CAP24175.1 Protein CBG02322 [Caenorhabditis briggsae]
MPSPSMYCLTAAEVPVSYTLGGCSTCGIPLDSCQTTLACPSGTAARLDGGSGDINGNSDGSPTFLYCSEAAGLWYGRIDGSDTPIISAACKYP